MNWWNKSLCCEVTIKYNGQAMEADESGFPLGEFSIYAAYLTRSDGVVKLR